MVRIMVLNDGETYTSLRGCKIVEIVDEVADDPDKIDEVLRLIDDGAATSLGVELFVFDGSEG